MDPNCTDSVQGAGYFLNGICIRSPCWLVVFRILLVLLSFVSPLYKVCLQNSQTLSSLSILTIVLLRQSEKKHCKMDTLPLLDELADSHPGVPIVPFSGLLKLLESTAYNSMMAANLPPFPQDNWFLRHWVRDRRLGSVFPAFASPNPLFSEGIEDSFPKRLLGI